MLPRAIEERGSVCGRMWCAVWQEVQMAVTDEPLLAAGPRRGWSRSSSRGCGPAGCRAAAGRACLPGGTCRTGKRDLQRRHGRARVLHGADVVACRGRIRAVGRERVAALHRLAVQRGGVLLHLGLVAAAAVDLRQRRLVGALHARDVGVAGDAGEAAVDRRGVAFLRHVQRDGAAAALGRQLSVGVAGEAVRGFLSQRASGQEPPEQHRAAHDPGESRAPAVAFHSRVYALPRAPGPDAGQAAGSRLRAARSARQ